MSDEPYKDHYNDFITWYLTKRMRCELGSIEDEELVTEWYINHLKDQNQFIEN